MWTKSKKIWYIAYRILAAWLPQSNHLKIAKKIRVWFAKRVIKNIGENVNIEKNAHFTPEVTIQDNSGIGISCELNGPIEIGKNVMMGPEVVIYTTNHRLDKIDIPMMYQGYDECKAVVIEDDVWIGRRVIIMPGVKIGKGSVIGAGAVVTKSIDEYSVAVGVPAKVIRKRG